MARAQVHAIDQKERRRIISELFEVVTAANSKKETVNILVGLLTSSEVLMIARRVQIAKLLLEEKNYQQIHDALGVGNGTITDVAKWLFGEDELLKKKVNKITKNESQKEYRTKKHNLLNPYGQLRALQELLDM